ncbi:hypothetical protein [Streptomyces sp. YIM B13518]
MDHQPPAVTSLWLDTLPRFGRGVACGGIVAVESDGEGVRGVR